jgi:hypothetical protein
MSAEIQTLLALAVVAVAATWLVLRALAKKKNPGCGGDCGCPASEIKVKVKSAPGGPAA